jgi:GNAT superfamily N-acetyltransferase
MKIKSLSSVTSHEIFSAFHEAFKNYIIPLVIEKDSTLQRWNQAGVNYNFSYGVTDNTELVAFILHAAYGETLFNFATGVVPSHRGQHLIEKIYEQVQVDIKGFKTYSLDVICENEKALRLYQKIGFHIIRTHQSLRGQIHIDSLLDSTLTYDILPLNYSQEMKDLRLARPGFENSPDALLLNAYLHEVHELRKDGELRAYAVFTPSTLSLREIGAKGDLKILDQLFLNMKLNGEALKIMNIDLECQDLVIYFKNRNLLVFVNQYEMEKKII